MKKAKMNHLYELVNLKLGGGKELNNYLNRARKEEKSYRTIADDLSKKVGITISKSSIHLWVTQ